MAKWLHRGQLLRRLPLSRVHHITSVLINHHRSLCFLAHLLHRCKLLLQALQLLLHRLHMGLLGPCCSCSPSCGGRQPTLRSIAVPVQDCDGSCQAQHCHLALRNLQLCCSAHLHSNMYCTLT